MAESINAAIIALDPVSKQMARLAAIKIKSRIFFFFQYRYKKNKDKKPKK